MNCGKKSNYLIVFTCLVVLGVSCKKYEEGPLISFKSTEARIIGDWKTYNYFIDGQEQTQILLLDQRLEFKEGGRYTQSEINITYNWEFYYYVTTSFEGNWSLQNKARDLVLTNPDLPGQDVQWEILQLKIKEIHLKRYSDHVFEWHLSKIMN